MQCHILLCTEAHNYLGFALFLKKYLLYIYIKYIYCNIYILVYRASLEAQLVKNPPAMRGTWVRFLV